MFLFDHLSTLLSNFFYCIGNFYVRGGKRSGRITYISGCVEVPTSFEEQSVL